MIDRIVNSFILRNLFVFTVVYSPVLAQHLFVLNASWKATVLNFISFTLFYCTYVIHNRIYYEKLLLKKRYILYIVAVLLTIHFSNPVFDLFRKLLKEPFTFKYTWYQKAAIFWTSIVYTYMALAVYIAFKHFRDKYRALNLEYLKRDLELKQLKEQLHPHFLFNALNNIYSYTVEHSAKAGELVMKLSELMRAVLVNSQRDKVELAEATAFIENYVAFEKERLGKRCDVSFTKDIHDTRIEIAPFIFLTFLENAFKHGTNSISQSQVNIALASDQNNITFGIRNSKMHSKTKVCSGMGIANAKRRLELLYPDRHDLQINETDSCYDVKLTITT